MATKDLAYMKISKDLVKQANVSYAKVKNDILTQEGIVTEALEFFVENFPKVAESQIKRKQSA
ncbi:MAG: hypothetical protein SH817_08725 [Leptospira sp.]|nr:hypothetical protein [Leptospira sp.]